MDPNVLVMCEAVYELAGRRLCMHDLKCSGPLVEVNSEVLPSSKI
jgi:hypothetical protein